MKKRSIAGSVTVTGPPWAICFVNISTTLPAEPSTLPKRMIEKRVAPCACSWRASTSFSATCLVAPMTFVGRTALSVEIMTKRATPCRTAASASWRVPSTLLSTASSGWNCRMGTCL